MSIFGLDSKLRKETPIFRGLLMYFPYACAAVARLSYKANEKHNPGEDMHWSRDRSSDHRDCVVRHIMEVDHLDDECGELAEVQAAWRALAVAQIAIEERMAEDRPYYYKVEDL